jgi:SAM-dependent methyltransferase
VHNNQLDLFRQFGEEHFRRDDRVLEIGPNLNQVAFKADNQVWHTTDIMPDPRLTYVMTEYSIPVPDASYDIVFSANVLEHVRKPWVWMRELARVCAPGGKVITLAPANWPYHEAPIDCWRVYPNGIKALYEDAGLEVIVAVCQRSSKKQTVERASWPWFVFPWWGAVRSWCTVVDTIAVGRKPE